MNSRKGSVYLVGAGPGDPRLITVRGRHLLRRADVVVHDRLIAPELLFDVRQEAEVVDVGKISGSRSIVQDQIHSMLLDRAGKGFRVVRLKGGDPYVFGRGYEEYSACREAGIYCEVVSGVTSAIAVPTAAGIPITDRRHVRSFAVVSARAADEARLQTMDFAALSAMDALVILMGRETLAEFTRSLTAAGRDPNTPTACVEQGTTPRQRVCLATLSSIAQAADRDGLSAPIVTVVGEVAGFARKNDRSLPENFASLRGKRIVLTRPRDAARRLARKLGRYGAIPIACPLLRIDYDVPLDPMDRAIHRLEEYAWVAFTSVHGVRAIAHRVQALGRDARVFARCRIAAVGPATSRALRRLGISADLTPPTFTGAALTASIQQVCKGRIGRVLYPRSDIAGPFFGERIRAAGGTVDELIAYRTVECPAPSSATRALSEGVDAIVFASPSAVRNFLKQKLSIRNACIACIGPTTAKAARELGMSVAIVADEHTDEGLSDSMGSFFTRKGTAG